MLRYQSRYPVDGARKVFTHGFGRGIAAPGSDGVYDLFVTLEHRHHLGVRGKSSVQIRASPSNLQRRVQNGGFAYIVWRAVNPETTPEPT